MHRPKPFWALLTVPVLLISTVVALDREKIKRLTPTQRGSGGLFTTYVADTLRKGEFSLGIVSHESKRDPNHLDIMVLPLSFQIGILDFLEVFGAVEAYKRVRAEDLFSDKFGPDDLLKMNDLLGLDPATYETLLGFPAGYAPALLSDGRIAFYNDAPFMDVARAEGRGELWAGVKLQVLSERKGAPVSLALQPIARFRTGDDRKRALRGLTAGAADYGFDGIITRSFPHGITLTGNAGFMASDDVRGIERQNRFNWGIGTAVPLGAMPVNVIGELVGSKFLGRKGFPLENINSILDVYGGVRLFPAKWMSLSAAANFHLRDAGSVDASLHRADSAGFFLQAVFMRKINLPPTLQCQADYTRVIEGESVRINVSAGDPDDSSLVLTWRASGGWLSEDGTSATLDTSGLTPGRYAVSVKASDDDSVASCSIDIVVEKRRKPPGISCPPGPYQVAPGQAVTLRAAAFDANGDQLSYSWSVDGQPITNDRPEFVFGSVGRSIGRHRVRAMATDVDRMSASCEFLVTVVPGPEGSP